MTDRKNIELERLNSVAKTYPHLKSLSNIAMLIGRAKQHFYTYKNRSGIGDEIMNELEDKLKINSRYIKFGEGNMLLSGINESNVKYEELAEVFPRRGNVSEIMDAPYGVWHELIKGIDVKNVTIGEMIMMRKAMLAKVDEFNKYIGDEDGE